MDGEVLLASFGAPVEAELARSLLESHDIPCRIADDILVGVALHLDRALGGVKLFVPAEDAERAASVLGEHERALKEERRVSDTADARVARAWRCAILGFFLFPVGLHLWSLGLLFKTPYSSVGEGARRKYWLSLLIDLVAVGLVVYVIAAAYA